MGYGIDFFKGHIEIFSGLVEIILYLLLGFVLPKTNALTFFSIFTLATSLFIQGVQGEYFKMFPKMFPANK